MVWFLAPKSGIDRGFWCSRCGFLGRGLWSCPSWSQVLVLVDSNSPAQPEAKARAVAESVAEGFWAGREAMQATAGGDDKPFLSVSAAVAAAQQAVDAGKGTVILTDAADATSSGASGNGASILAELVKQGYTGTARCTPAASLSRAPRWWCQHPPSVPAVVLPSVWPGLALRGFGDCHGRPGAGADCRSGRGGRRVRRWRGRCHDGCPFGRLLRRPVKLSDALQLYTTPRGQH